MNARKNPAAVALGRLGGKAGTGAAKARTAEQCRLAAAIRWELYRVSAAHVPTAQSESDGPKESRKGA